MGFRRPSLSSTKLRGNVCGHCVDINGSAFREAPWRGSRPGSPTTATTGSSPATAIPKDGNLEAYAKNVNEAQDLVDRAIALSDKPAPKKSGN